MVLGMLRLLMAATSFALLPALINANSFITKVGDRLPDAVAPLVVPKAPDFTSTGKVTALAFIDCSSKRCEEMLPLLERDLWGPLKDQPFQLIAISVRTTNEDASALAQSTSVTFPVVADPRGEVFGLFSNDGVPRMVIFDKGGRLAYQHAGYRIGREAEFRKVADLLIADKKLPADIQRRQAPPAAPEPNLMALSILGQQAPEVPVETWITDPAPDATGRFVLVDFWATWCGPCIVALDMAEPLHHQFEDQLVTIAVSDEPPSTVQAMVRRKGWKQPIGTDPQARAKRALQIRGIPHAFLADPSGKVIWEGHPAALWGNNAAGLRRLLEQGAKSTE